MNIFKLFTTQLAQPIGVCKPPQLFILVRTADVQSSNPWRIQSTIYMILQNCSDVAHTFDCRMMFLRSDIISWHQYLGSFKKMSDEIQTPQRTTPEFQHRLLCAIDYLRQSPLMLSLFEMRTGLTVNECSLEKMLRNLPITCKL
jgi:hypothetical protein